MKRAWHIFKNHIPQSPHRFISPTSSQIIQEDSSGKIRERTSINSSPAGRYVTGPERCPANIRMRLFTLLPLGVIKNYRDRRSVAAPISAMQLVVLCAWRLPLFVSPLVPRACRIYGLCVVSLVERKPTMGEKLVRWFRLTRRSVH